MQSKQTDRPRKVSEHEGRNLIRALQRLRRERLMAMVGMNEEVSNEPYCVPLFKAEGIYFFSKRGRRDC